MTDIKDKFFLVQNFATAVGLGSIEATLPRRECCLVPRFPDHFDTQRDIVGSAQRLRSNGSESPHEAGLGDRGGDQVLRNEGEGGHAQAVSLQRRHLWINQLEKVLEK